MVEAAVWGKMKFKIQFKLITENGCIKVVTLPSFLTMLIKEFLTF